MYNYTSRLFSCARHAHAWESCDCERNVKEERVFHMDSFAVPGTSSTGFLSASFKFVGPGYLNESVAALRAAVQVTAAVSWASSAHALLCHWHTASAEGCPRVWQGMQPRRDEDIPNHGCAQDFGVSGHDGGWVQFHIGLWNRRGLKHRVPLKPILQEVHRGR